MSGLSSLFDFTRTSAGGVSKEPGADNSKAAQKKRAHKRLIKKLRAKNKKNPIETIRDISDGDSTVGVIDGSNNGTRAKTIKEALEAAGAD